MTVTPIAPAITLCPVAWCPDAGQPEWNWVDHPTADPDHFHKRETVNVPTGYGRSMIVAAEVQLLLAELDQRNPGRCDRCDRDGGHRGCSDRLWREL